MSKEEHDFEKFYEGFKDRNDAFLNSLLTQDDLGLVVRAHLHIEHELREFIISAAPSPGQVKATELDFDSTVRLALVLGLDSELKPALNAIGNLRNKFAHRLNMTLGEMLSKNLSETLTSRSLSILKSGIRESTQAALTKGYRLKGRQRTRLEVSLFFGEVRTSLIEERFRVEKARSRCL
jgi:hypothetical protein